MSDYVDIVKFLIEKGADISKADIRVGYRSNPIIAAFFNIV